MTEQIKKLNAISVFTKTEPVYYVKMDENEFRLDELTELTKEFVKTFAGTYIFNDGLRKKLHEHGMIKTEDVESSSFVCTATDEYFRFWDAVNCLYWETQEPTC